MKELIKAAAVICAILAAAAILRKPSVSMEAEVSDTEYTNSISMHEYNYSEINIHGQTLEEYTKRALAAQNAPELPKEALKALSVALRTGALCAPESCPYYPEAVMQTKGADHAEAAALETAGMILTYNSEPIIAAYHLSSDTTENAADLFGKDIPYLKSVKTTCTDDISEKCFTLTEIEARISAEYKEASRFDYEEADITEHGTVLSARLCGITLTGERIAELLTLESPAFTVKASSTTVTFTTHGTGSRLGLCIKGAALMAEQGKAYDDILSYYYPETTISTLK